MKMSRKGEGTYKVAMIQKIIIITRKLGFLMCISMEMIAKIKIVIIEDLNIIDHNDKKIIILNN